MEVGQSYVTITFDLGMCMKAYPLIWNNTSRYEKYIILIGTFHMIYGYFRVLGKKMAGSELVYVFTEADLITPGSLHWVMTGKNYSRAVQCHKTMQESIERLVIQQYLTSPNQEGILSGLSEESTNKMKDLIESPSEQALVKILELDDIVASLDEYIMYRTNIRKDTLSKTAQFWLSYKDHVGLVLVSAVKCNNFPFYAQCISISL